MKFKRILIALFLIVPVLVLLAVGLRFNPRELPSAWIGKTAPDFKLPLILEKEELQLSALRGRPVVVHFWATWCGPCEAEWPVFRQLSQIYGDRVAWISVLTGDQMETALPYLKERHLLDGFLHTVDQEGHLAVDYGVTGVPESFILDANGRVVTKRIGIWDAPALQNVLEKLL